MHLKFSTNFICLSKEYKNQVFDPFVYILLTKTQIFTSIMRLLILCLPHLHLSDLHICTRKNQHMTLVLSSSLHTFQVNDTWQRSKANSEIEKPEVKLLLPVL